MNALSNSCLSISFNHDSLCMNKSVKHKCIKMPTLSYIPLAGKNVPPKRKISTIMTCDMFDVTLMNALIAAVAKHGF